MKKTMLMFAVSVLISGFLSGQKLEETSVIQSSSSEVIAIDEKMQILNESKGITQRHHKTTILWSDDFSTDKSWTLESGWTRGVATNEPSGDHTQTGDNMILGGPLNVDYANSILSPIYATTPVINCASATLVILDFWSFSGSETNTYDHLGIEVYNGTSWIPIWTNSSGSFQEVSWTPYSFDVTAYAAGNANFQVRFYYGPTDGSVQYSGWAVDDIVIFEPSANDVGVESIGMISTYPNATLITPSAVVKNFGSATQTFDVEISIHDGTANVYTDVVNVANLAVGTTQTVDFADWTTAYGNYTVTVASLLAGDANTSNDTLTSTFNVIDTKKIYCIPMGAYTTLTRGPSYFYTHDPTTIHLITANATDNIYAGVWADGQWLGANATDFSLVSIDTLTGAVTTIGSTGGVQLNGLAYDVVDSVLYAISSTDLYTVDISTGAITLVGSCGVSGSIFINLACSPGGQLYSVEMNTDVFYSIDKTTGAATSIGPLGYDLNYAQDMGYDIDNNILFIAAYSGGGVGAWATIDVATGAMSPSLGNPGNAELCALAIPYTLATPPVTYPVTFEVINGNGSLTASVDGTAISSGDEVEEGKDVVFTATPDVDFEVLEWTLDGSVIPGLVLANYTLTNLSDTAHVTVEFVLIDTTSVEQMNITAINIYPNPASDIISITSDADYVLTIYDAMGRQIEIISIINGNNYVDMKKYRKGIYYFNFIGKDNYSIKIIKE